MGMLEQLYAQVGKTPDMIDATGRDYWQKRLDAGEDITNPFKTSAAQVYHDMVGGAVSPYKAENTAGFANVQDMMRGGTAGDFNNYLSATGMSPGQIGVIDNNHPNGVYAGAYDPNRGPGGYERSPYLDEIAGGITGQFNRNLNATLASQRSGASVAGGGVGGSREGIMEGRAVADSQTGLAGALANLYGTDYTNSMNRSLQKYGMDQNYDISRGNLALGHKNADNSFTLGNKQADNSFYLGNQGQMLNFYGQQRGQDMDAVRLGADLDGLATQRYMQQGRGIYDLGTQQQDAQWRPLQRASDIYGNYTGYGSTTTSGGGAQGFVGGAGGAYQLYRGMNGGGGYGGEDWRTTGNGMPPSYMWEY